MEVPRLGVESELSIAAGPHHSHSNARTEPHLCPCYSSGQGWILYPLSNASDQTRILMDTSQARFH